MTLTGATGATEIFLSGGGLGDASVQVPADAISASEILDEAGVANRIQSASVELSGSTDFDILIRTITVPTSGYVIAAATGMISMFHVNDGLTSANYGIVAPGSNLLSSPKVWATIPSSTPTGTHVVPISITAAFAVTAGSHQFSLQAEEASIGSGVPTVMGSQLTLLFVPTAYGTFTSNVANSNSGPMESRESESGAAEEFSSRRVASELQELRAKLDALQTQVEQNEN